MPLPATTTDTEAMMEEYVDWDAMLADCVTEPSDASTSVCSTSTRAESPTSDVARIYDAPPCPERDLCRDYTCCGLRLADLHALVCHFEEEHVVCDEAAVGRLLDPVTSAFGTFVVRTSDARAARAAGPYPTRRLDKAEAPVCLSLRELERRPKLKVASQAQAQAERKKYVCPRAGCIKSYRNASGLDYHLRKGTCVVRAC